MKAMTLALLGMVAAASAQAQTSVTSTSMDNAATASSHVRPDGVVTTTPGAPLAATPGVNQKTGTTTGTGILDRNTGVAAAAGNRNQAVTTTTANAPQPARGANSFTRGEARRRLEASGMSEVGDLQKDNNGIWRGTAKKGQDRVGVWLDYKGNVGIR